ncbi:hypothetical protein [Runella zeae]|uniref:hypothetical protein n=1 Tax=Runella zeae TaxID=94255 RepID=UPI00042712D7|nr:hypothetical protein [Runella zeae]
MILLDWLIYGALVVLLAVQVGLIWRQKNVPKFRFWLRIGLNGLLWLVLVGWVANPQWTIRSNTNRVLVVGEKLPQTVIQKNKDSLQITETFPQKDFAKRLAQDPNFSKHLGEIYLLGQSFDGELVSQLSHNDWKWLPFFAKDSLQTIKWRGILRKNEFQEVAGALELSEAAVLKIVYGQQVLDSVVLEKGFQKFRLRFPAFAIGRTHTQLLLNNQLLKNIAFYTRKPSPLSVYFILQSPDFESKTLAEWLGKKNGSRVEVLTTVAKNTQSTIAINNAANQKTFVPDIVITDPSNASHSLVKKNISEGRSVLFYSLTQPESELKGINQMLGTQWSVRKISNAELLPLEKGMTVLPFELVKRMNQKKVEGFPIAVQKAVGRVGVSLLNETFPLKLSGDTLTYEKIWAGVFQQLAPALKGNIAMEAPIWKDTKASFVLNQWNQPSVSLANDTAQVNPSNVNPQTATLSYVFRDTGWQPFQDSLQIYVETENEGLGKTKQITELLEAHKVSKLSSSKNTHQDLRAQWPDWAWAVLIVLCLSMLWIEPKIPTRF